MRVFVGISLNKEMKGSLHEAAREAQNHFPGRYASQDNYHCTLQFIGQADAAAVLAAEKAVRDAVGQVDSFPMELTGLSFFRRPQDAVLFCGLKKSPPLTQLACCVRERLLAAGFKLEEGAFHPHITIARQARLDPAKLSLIHVTPQTSRQKKSPCLKVAGWRNNCVMCPLCAALWENRASTAGHCSDFCNIL